MNEKTHPNIKSLLQDLVGFPTTVSIVVDGKRYSGNIVSIKDGLIVLHTDRINTFQVVDARNNTIDAMSMTGDPAILSNAKWLLSLD